MTQIREIVLRITDNLPLSSARLLIEKENANKTGGIIWSRLVAADPDYRHINTVTYAGKPSGYSGGGGLADLLAFLNNKFDWGKATGILTYEHQIVEDEGDPDTGEGREVYWSLAATIVPTYPRPKDGRVHPGDGTRDLAPGRYYEDHTGAVRRYEYEEGGREGFIEWVGVPNPEFPDHPGVVAYFVQHFAVKGPFTERVFPHGFSPRIHGLIDEPSPGAVRDTRG